MPLLVIDPIDVSYYLWSVDKDGVEESEDGRLLSADIKTAVKDGVTDVFVASHGWKGDVPAAIDQYTRWITAMFHQTDDRELAHNTVAGFKSLIVGVHWPSLPWGDESTAGVLGDDDELANELELDTDALVDRYVKRIADTPTARQALDSIMASVDDESAAEQLQSGFVPEDLASAYQVLFEESRLAVNGGASAPGSDVDRFSPADIAAQWIKALNNGGDPSAADAGVLGFGVWAKIRDVVLAPVRQLSFWAMKRRARVVGENGVHQLIRDIQLAAPSARIHLMGHSFGCIVVSSAIAGPLSAGLQTDRLPRPVDSLFLVQGAMSLWSFADEIPFKPFDPGFYGVLCESPRAVRGPLVTTLSMNDRAVGWFYPIGARLGGQQVLGDDELPEFGGTGTFGVQGTHVQPELIIMDAEHQYDFEEGVIYNVESSRIIRNGGGASGAHSDIVHPEVAHLFWQAALATM